DSHRAAASDAARTRRLVGFVRTQSVCTKRDVGYQRVRSMGCRVRQSDGNRHGARTGRRNQCSGYARPIHHVLARGVRQVEAMSERILIVRASSMGDLIHTLPAVSDLARAFPGVPIDWVAEESFAEIPHWHPAVDDVIPVALRRWRKAWWS